MENEIIRNRTERKFSYFIPVIILSVLLAVYIVMMIISPVHKISEIRKRINQQENEKGDVSKSLSYDSAYLELSKEKAFLQSRIAMAETDSIFLTINLSDSTSSLELSGVVVHRTKISKITASRMLARGDEKVILSILGSPLTIFRDYSTIKKEPVMIKMAPKDTSEYKPDIMPDTSVTEPVNYLLEMTNGVRVFVYEEEGAKNSDRMSRFFFDLKIRLRDSFSSIISMVSLKIPEYHPYIKIRIPRSDAKIIYRAIPKYGQVSVYT